MNVCVAVFNGGVQAVQEVAIGPGDLRHRQRVQDRFVVFIDQKHNALTDAPRDFVIKLGSWDTVIYIYTPHPLDESLYRGYQPTARQYNVRLMD